MEILQLKYFLDSAKCENFSKTAKKFIVPPSAVSQSIRRLENELGFLLFDRKSNKIFLNADGKVFYEAVTKAFDILDDAKKIISDKSNTVSGEISLNILCNRRIVAHAINEFKQLYPNVYFRLNHSPVTDEKFDIIIDDNPSKFSGYSSLPLLTEQISVAFNKKHPLAKKKSIKLSELKNEQFIAMEKHGRLTYLTYDLCEKGGFIPNISIQCDDPFYIRKYIEMGLGIGFVPLFSWHGQISENLKLIPLEDCFRTTYASFDTKSYTSDAIRLFLELLKKLCKK